MNLICNDYLKIVVLFQEFMAEAVGLMPALRSCHYATASQMVGTTTSASEIICSISC